MNNYYSTFVKPHVHLESSGIERIEPDGIVACDGTKRHIDLLVLATGFNVWDDNLPAIEVISGKANLGKWWRETKFQAYPRYLGSHSQLLVDGKPVRLGGALVVQHR